MRPVRVEVPLRLCKESRRSENPTRKWGSTEFWTDPLPMVMPGLWSTFTRNGLISHWYHSILIHATSVLTRLKLDRTIWLICAVYSAPTSCQFLRISTEPCLQIWLIPSGFVENKIYADRQLLLRRLTPHNAAYALCIQQAVHFIYQGFQQHRRIGIESYRTPMERTDIPQRRIHTHTPTTGNDGMHSNTNRRNPALVN